MTTPGPKGLSAAFDDLVRDAYLKYAADRETSVMSLLANTDVSAPSVPVLVEKDLGTTSEEWSEDGSLTVRRLVGHAVVSCCSMTDSTGVNHCDHPAPPRPPWHRRLRWRLSSKWSALRIRAGSWVAGVDLDDREDW